MNFKNTGDKKQNNSVNELNIMVRSVLVIILVKSIDRIYLP